MAVREISRVVATGLGRKVLGHPLYIWLIWAAAVLVLAASPMILSDPVLWFSVFDPELLALIVIVGIRYTGWEIGVLWLRIRDLLGRRPGAIPTPNSATSPIVGTLPAP